MSRIDWRKLASRAGKFSTYALTAFAGLLIIGAIAFVAVPRLMNWQGTVVLTGSMEPKMPTGSLIFVDRDVDPAAMKVGDIVTYLSAKSGQVTHRIVNVTMGVNGPEYQTKGDANNNADEGVVLPSQVQGRVITTIPHAGSWSNSLQDKANFKMMIWPILGLIILSEAWNIAGQMRKRSTGADATALPASTVRLDLLSTGTASPTSDNGRSTGE